MSSKAALETFGQPGGAHEGSYMQAWQVPADLRGHFAHVRFSSLGVTGFPARIYCHRALRPLLEAGLRNLISRGLTQELVSWDGCYIVRNARGLSSWSMHAWGLAFDINAATNRLGAKPTLSAAFVKCFTDAGLVWGGTWRRADGMHFEVPKTRF